MTALFANVTSQANPVLEPTREFLPPTQQSSGPIEPNETKEMQRSNNLEQKQKVFLVLNL